MPEVMSKLPEERNLTVPTAAAEGDAKLLLAEAVAQLAACLATSTPVWFAKLAGHLSRE